MRHNKKTKILDREKAHRDALMRNLATSFILYEKIKTTQAKAKVLRPYVEKIISLGRKDTLANRRLVGKKLYISGAIKKTFEVIGPRYKERPGGYTRITKLGTRQGDRAEMVQIELV